MSETNHSDELYWYDGKFDVPGSGLSTGLSTFVQLRAAQPLGHPPSFDDTCRHFKAGYCKMGSKCRFSHTLKPVSATSPIPPPVIPSPPPSQFLDNDNVALVQKTCYHDLCRHFKAGYCKMGIKCRFSHSLNPTSGTDMASAASVPIAPATLMTQGISPSNHLYPQRPVSVSSDHHREQLSWSYRRFTMNIEPDIVDSPQSGRGIVNPTAHLPGQGVDVFASFLGLSSLSLLAPMPSLSSSTTAESTSSIWHDVHDKCCAVCLSGASHTRNEIVVCHKCDVAVHQKCYISKEIPQGGVWYCSPCVAGFNPLILKCELCSEMGGAYMQSAQNGKWLHCSCFKWIIGPFMPMSRSSRIGV